MKARAAVVITTYNNPHFLGLCLKSFTNQTEPDFDIHIADDGSKDTTKAKIEEFRPAFPGRLTHHWHPDEGYRKAKINNSVFQKLDGKYPIVICVDGDIVAHYRFVEDHIQAHGNQPRTVFMGRRVDLGPLVTAQLTEENVPKFNRGLNWLLMKSLLAGDTRHFSRTIRISNPRLRQFLSKPVPDLLGSNYSLSTSLLFEVNGYDEDFTTYWGEDGDIYIRLRNVGAKMLGSKAIALQYHLHHPRLAYANDREVAYRARLEDRTYTYCRNGIVKENSH